MNELAFPMKCDPSMIVPFGEARDIAYQTCALAGSKPGSLIVQGSDFLGESFGYTHHHLWRNVGVIVSRAGYPRRFLTSFPNYKADSASPLPCHDRLLSRHCI